MGFINNACSYPSHFFDGGSGADPIDSILELAHQVTPNININLLRKIHYDVVAIFQGKSGDFRKNILPYHTLRHTMMVAVAAMRLLHGLFLKGERINNTILLQGLLCAYFHDVGMLIKIEEAVKNPFCYIPIHERRSASFLTEYVTLNDLNPALACDVDTILLYTCLSADPQHYPSHSPQVQMLGQLVGTADLLAQMGDRYYLESLPSLFLELFNSRLTIHKSADEMMQDTISFYHNIVLDRLFTTYLDVIDAMRMHFQVHYCLNRNLYLEAIDKNMQYLQKILHMSPDFPKSMLRRKVPII